MMDIENNLCDPHSSFIAEYEAQAKKARVEQLQPTAAQQMDEGEHIIREAEASKARLYATPGKDNFWHNVEKNKAQISAMVDENYLVIGAHVDPAVQLKIINNEYVDFARLVPRNKLAQDEDHRMELVTKGGFTYFVPVSDRETTAINKFSRWEQAFRAYATIYCGANPHRSKEIWQYISVINTAATAYSWDNVYNYDITFRHLMAFNPQRSWAVTYN